MIMVEIYWRVWRVWRVLRCCVNAAHIAIALRHALIAQKMTALVCFSHSEIDGLIGACDRAEYVNVDHVAARFKRFHA
jgi:hypothetical protein